MKKFWSTLVIVLVLLPFGVASADSMSVAQVIHLYGIVPPMRFVVVDSHGGIIEITSNTPQNVTPQVRLGSLSHGPKLPFTPSLQKDYESKIKGVDMHSTDLHFAAATHQAAKVQKPTFLAGLMKLSLLPRMPWTLR